MHRQVRDPSVSPAAPEAAAVPICVDLDGTLVRTNMLTETAVAAVKRKPWLAAALPLWLARGRAALKRELARRASIDASVLPYDENLLALLRRSRAAGRRLYIATASDTAVAQAIADHLGIFDGVLASDGARNLKGEAKARALVERFGDKGFDFVGEDRFDLPAWRHARAAIRVGDRAGVAGELGALGIPVEVVPRERGGWTALAKGMRLYQWAKNALVFVPLLTAHRLLDASAVTAAWLAFAAFSLAASAVYLANDLADLDDDRRHPTKRARALASGALPVGAALALVPLLVAAAAALAWRLPWEFGALLVVYLAANIAYSLGLKRFALLDVFVLAALYTVRILAGAAAIDVPVSHWLLAFSMFVFLSLALAKRFVEVANVAAREEDRVGGRGYLASDGQLLGMLGTASGYLSVLVFALYITSRDVAALYARPQALWFATPFLLYWISRVWLLAHRGELHEDPLLFALHDPPSYVAAMGVLAAMVIAT